MSTETGAIYAAMVVVMDQIGFIGKGGTNTQQNYKFRGIDQIYQAAQPALIKAKIFVLPEVLNISEGDYESKGGGNLHMVRLTMAYHFVSGDDGSRVTAIVMGEAMDSGDKACNKAMSAAQKYAFLQAFCIPTEEAKDAENDTYQTQGNRSVPQPRSEAAARKTTAPPISPPTDLELPSVPMLIPGGVIVEVSGKFAKSIQSISDMKRLRQNYDALSAQCEAIGAIVGGAYPAWPEDMAPKDAHYEIMVLKARLVHHQKEVKK